MKSGDDDGESNTASAPPGTHGPSSSSSTSNDRTKNASPLMQQVALAMDLTDVIRKHNAPVTNDEKNNGFLRTFLMTPGVQQGFFTLFLCTAVAVPTRRFVLSVSKRQLNLGTVFPDLMITPALAMLTAQFALFTGSCYGCAAYLDRLANIAPTAPSPIADSVCNDPKFTQAATVNSNHGDAPPLLQLPDEDSSSWDPRVSAVESMRRALQSCRERRAFQQQQQLQDNNTAVNESQQGDNALEKEMSTTTRISWWKSS